MTAQCQSCAWRPAGLGCQSPVLQNSWQLLGTWLGCCAHTWLQQWALPVPCSNLLQGHVQQKAPVFLTQKPGRLSSSL